MESQLVAAFRRLSPHLKWPIAQGVLSKTEWQLLERYRTLTVRERARVRKLITEFAGRAGPGGCST
jgi:hypothetical protein